MVEEVSTLQPEMFPMPEQGDMSRRNGSPWRAHVAAEVFSLKGLYPMGRTHVGAGEKCEEEGAAEGILCGLSASLHSPSLCTVQGQGGGRGVRNEGES